MCSSSGYSGIGGGGLRISPTSNQFPSKREKPVAMVAGKVVVCGLTGAHTHFYERGTTTVQITYGSSVVSST
jgi:hypothetical protein